MLRVEDLHVHYGGIHALKGIELAVGEGQIVALIGANGAGKSTTLNTISGLVRFGRQSGVLGQGHHQCTLARDCENGIVPSSRGQEDLPEMTVIENLLMGAYIRNGSEEIKADNDLVFDLFPGSRKDSIKLQNALSGGEQQMLAIGRGLMSRPKLLLLDEPSMGLAPLLVKEIFNIV